MRKAYTFITPAIVFLFLLFSCAEHDKKFQLISSAESGITFKNTVTPSVEFNILNYMYFYNGGGVAVGDFNGDGFADIYFTSNQQPNALYLNKGNFKFQNITQAAGVEGFNGWATGVTTADVNNDGRLDIYVSYLGDYLIYKGKNQLFINEGNNAHGVPTFTDKAIDYGLDLAGLSTQAAFFDYDRDGDIDMFMLNHSLHQQGTYGKAKDLRYQIHPTAGDKLLRNDNGHFVDVTTEAGIYSSVLGYGLGLVVSDVNLDGWPDIYVGNDFHENDYLYINQGNGTFKESLEDEMMHTSRFTMGVDYADINNDAFPDLIAMDMLPEDPQILKSSAAEDSYDIYNYKVGFGYNHQFARNTLQLNNQDGTFSEIGLQAGVSSTDWSWSALLADFDLDGYKDILISNGIPRRPNDLDYINFMQGDSINKNIDVSVSENEMAYIDKMPKIKIANFLYVNNHNSTFTNKAPEWGLDQLSYSNGTAYADFDNDGDLDIVINNIDDEAFLYENKTINIRGSKDSKSNHYLQFELKGKAGNIFGLGAKVFLYNKNDMQMLECMPTRGFESSVDYTLTFGAGDASQIDSIKVIWNDGSFQNLLNVKTNQRIKLDQQQATGAFNYAGLHASKKLFIADSTTLGISFKHRENKFNEFTREQLLPHMLSAEGPASAVGDVNGDGRDDIFIGGGKWQGGKIFVQNTGGKFVNIEQSVIKSDSTFEDVDAVFFDADGDKDNDLFVVTGGNEFFGNSEYQQPRLYTNDGKGDFSRSKGLPEIYLTGSCVSLNDIDNDGDVDLFLGARSTPWKYGMKPDSYFLQNDGKGFFTDITKTNAPTLKSLGFVKSSIWADVDNDKDADLIIAGEWMPITILLNNNGKLEPLKMEGSGLEKSNGWWNTIYPYDFDKDGDIDLIAGNLGLNSKLHAATNEPVKMYVNDFDRNGTREQMLTHFMKGKEYPFYTRDEMTKQLPGLKKKFLSYRKFGEATITDIFPKDTLDSSDQYVAYTFESQYIENLGGGKFKMKSLPSEVQFSTTNAVLADDFNGDGKQDVLLAGNFYPNNIQMGRYDASYGLLLLGDNSGNFKPVPPYQSGFSVRGETRHLNKVMVGKKAFYIAVRNNDTIKVFSLKNDK